MDKNALLQRLAICTWSLQPENPEELIQTVKEIGIPRIQCGLDPLRADPKVWGSFADLCDKNDIQLISGMVMTEGEDYSTLDSIKRTGGVVPDETWDTNWKNIQIMAQIAKDLGLNFVSFHAGFIPHEETDPSYPKLVDRICKIADLFGDKGITLGFETGQEDAETLNAFLTKLNRANVGVNFDPANMLLYDKGDPIEAVKALGPWLRQCHIKDANKTKVPGTWGEEVVAGTGEVDWVGFFKALKEVKYEGDFAIEREAGDQRAADIKAGKEYILAQAELI